MKNLKKFLGAAAVRLLVGAGCGAQTGTQVEVETDVNAQPVPPSAPPGGGADAGANAGVEVEVETGSGSVEVTTEAELKADVSITAGGTFSPATLTVKKGASVTWTNSGSAKVWIASDPHPVHTGYPGFDSGTDLRAGESFTFTFDKTGSWSYHNHLNPTVKGTVIVTE